MVGGARAPEGRVACVTDSLPLLWRHHPGRRDHRVSAAASQRPVRDASADPLYVLSPRGLRAPAGSGRSGRGSDAGRRSGLKKTEGGLQLHDVLRRGALLTLHDLELHALAFGQRLEPFTLNRGVMHEAVLAAALRRDEAEALGVVEPLHGTGNACHRASLLACTVPAASCLALTPPLNGGTLVETFLLHVLKQARLVI